MTWRNIERNRDLFLGLLSKAHSIIVFDTETTGLGSNAKIIEFAGIRYEVREQELVATGSLHRMINPQEPLEEKIVEITGITDEVLSHANPEEIEAPEIFSFLESADTWAAYNCGFDLRMLHQMADRTRRAFLESPCLDILEMARDHISKEELKSHRLGAVTEYLFPDECFQYHSALDDTKAAAKCMARFLSMYAGVTEHEKKRQVRLNWASFCVNPNQRSQVRIKLNLVEGDYGDIFWDVKDNCWSCKKTSKAAKKLFEEIDLANLESQVLKRYGWRYKAADMSALASNWGKEKRAASKKERS